MVWSQCGANITPSSPIASRDYYNPVDPNHPVRSIGYYPNGHVQSDCYADKSNHTCVEGTEIGATTATSYDGTARVVAIVSKCADGSVYNEEHSDDHDARDGMYQQGTCGTNSSATITTKASFSHGALDGPYYRAVCRLSETGQYKNGARWGKWTFSSMIGNIYGTCGFQASGVTRSITLNNGNGPWVLSDNQGIIEEGNLKDGLEDGLWRYLVNNTGLIASGSYFHGAKDGIWRLYTLESV